MSDWNTNWCRKCEHARLEPENGESRVWVCCEIKESSDWGIWRVFSYHYGHYFSDEIFEKGNFEHLEFNLSFKPPQACPYLLEYLMKGDAEHAS